MDDIVKTKLVVEFPNGTRVPVEFAEGGIPEGAILLRDKRGELVGCIDFQRQDGVAKIGAGGFDEDGTWIPGEDYGLYVPLGNNGVSP